MESIFNQKFINCLDTHKYFVIDLTIQFQNNHYKTYEDCEAKFDPNEELLCLSEPGEDQFFIKIPLEIISEYTITLKP